MTNKKWNYYTHIWKTESEYLTWLRGQIRTIWNKCPQKIEFLKKQRQLNPKYNKDGETIKNKDGSNKLFVSYICNNCQRICYLSEKIEGRKSFSVDHIIGNHSLTSLDDIQNFITSIVMVKPEDLQILCKPCHDIKTYSEKYNISFEDAIYKKQAIKICNEKKDNQFFINRNLSIPKTKALRQEAIFKILKDEQTKSN